MSRRSTALPRGSHFSLTCDGCWEGFNAFANSWDEVEAQAAREGWRFTGYGMSAREFCRRCA